MGRRQRHTAAGYDEGEAFGIVACRFDANVRAFDRADASTLGPGADRAVEVRQREVALIIGPRKPLGRHTADTLTARDIDLEAGRRGSGTGNHGVHVGCS